MVGGEPHGRPHLRRGPGLIPASASRSGQLAKSGLWAGVADYWQIAEFEETQTTRADLAHLDGQRRKARDRKRAERARRVPHDVAGDVTSDSTRTGQDRRTKGKRGTTACVR
jgi:hypothetical protein